MTRNLIISIDGTGNDEFDTALSNVRKFHEALQPDGGSSGIPQVTIYHRGIGNEVDNDEIGQKLGFNFGFGGMQIRNEAYNHLVESYQPGDRLYIMGFSRGAAIARSLANRLAKRGIKRRAVEIQMMGLWDTVGSFGIPVNLGPIPFQRINLFYDFAIPSNVNYLCHLLSIDEMRSPFAPTLTQVKPHIDEIWFAGVHADIGGGVEERGLSDITLAYMIERAQAHGLAFDPNYINGLKPDFTAPFFESSLDLPSEVRKIEVQTEDDTIDSKPKLHHTVLARMDDSKLNYQPENVLSLGGKYQIIS